MNRTGLLHGQVVACKRQHDAKKPPDQVAFFMAAD